MNDNRNVNENRNDNRNVDESQDTLSYADKVKGGKSMIQVNTPVVHYDQFEYMIDVKDDEPNKYNSRSNHLPIICGPYLNVFTYNTFWKSKFIEPSEPERKGFDVPDLEAYINFVKRTRTCLFYLPDLYTSANINNKYPMIVGIFK